MAIAIDIDDPCHTALFIIAPLHTAMPGGHDHRIAIHIIIGLLQLLLRAVVDVLDGGITGGDYDRTKVRAEIDNLTCTSVLIVGELSTIAAVREGNGGTILIVVQLLRLLLGFVVSVINRSVEGSRINRLTVAVDIDNPCHTTVLIIAPLHTTMSGGHDHRTAVDIIIGFLHLLFFFIVDTFDGGILTAGVHHRLQLRIHIGDARHVARGVVGAEEAAAAVREGDGGVGLVVVELAEGAAAVVVGVGDRGVAVRAEVGRVGRIEVGDGGGLHQVVVFLVEVGHAGDAVDEIAVRFAVGRETEVREAGKVRIGAEHGDVVAGVVAGCCEDGRDVADILIAEDLGEPGAGLAAVGLDDIGIVLAQDDGYMVLDGDGDGMVRIGVDEVGDLDGIGGDFPGIGGLVGPALIVDQAAAGDDRGSDEKNGEELDALLGAGAQERGPVGDHEDDGQQGEQAGIVGHGVAEDLHADERDEGAVQGRQHEDGVACHAKLIRPVLLQEKDRKET